MSRDAWGVMLLAGGGAFVVLFVVLFINNLVYLAKMRGFLEYLKTHHSQRYQALGSPSFFVRSAPGPMWAVIKFIFGREFFGDSELEKKAGQLRRGLKLSIGLMVVLVLLFAMVALGFQLASK